MKMQASAHVVAHLYRDFAGTFVLDQVDGKQAGDVEALDVRPVVTNTIMSGLRERKSLARAVLEALEMAA
jgi:hypothetical protein